MSVYKLILYKIALGIEDTLKEQEFLLLLASLESIFGEEEALKMLESVDRNGNIEFVDMMIVNRDIVNKIELKTDNITLEFEIIKAIELTKEQARMIADGKIDRIPADILSKIRDIVEMMFRV